MVGGVGVGVLVGGVGVESWWVALVWSHPAQAGSYAIFES